MDASLAPSTAPAAGRATTPPSIGLFSVALLAALAACSPRSEAPATTPGTAPAAATGTAAAPTAVEPGAPSAAPSTQATGADGIAWRPAATDAAVDAAFAEAREAGKPLFLYWGATWCPPCNQVKATLFNRQDFIERSRAFVPVFVDGDKPGAQKIGARFHISGYPTMLLLKADGTEITRLPGEVEPARYTEVLTLGMNARRPAKAVLADALAGGSGLAPADWRLLAFYSWETDEQRLVPRAEVPATLQRLAAACPADEVDASARLWLKALAAREGPARDDPAGAARLEALLGDDAAVHRHYDVLAGNAADLVRATSTAGTPARDRLLGRYDGVLRALERDVTLSRADRLGGLAARLDLARIDQPKRGEGTASAPPPPPVSAALQAEVRAAAAKADREITDGYERQAVIGWAADLLDDAGLPGEASALLEANLARSHSPYYFMSGLAVLAQRHGDRAGALRWYGSAWEKSEGPATRLQWGARYVVALVELAPTDETAIETTAARVLDEAAAQPDAFYERSGRSLKRLAKTVRDWNGKGAHAAAFARFDARLEALCGKLDAADAQRATCEAVRRGDAKAVS
jgi:hypothetical protein